MTTKVEIKIPDLSRVALEPGDTLLVRTPLRIDQAMAAAIKDQIGRYFPDHTVIVMAEGLEMAVLRPVQDGSTG